MRLAATVATVCVCTIGTAGCGADDAARKVQGTVDPVARAAEKTSASGGARIEGVMNIHASGITIPMTAEGAISFEEERMKMTLDIGQVKGLRPAEMDELRRASEMPIEYVQTPDEIYASTGKVRERGRAQGIDWVKVDLSELDEEAGLDLQRANQYSEVNPDALLRALRTTGDARKVGATNIRGVTADRYRATIDMRRYPELVPEADREKARRTADLMAKSMGGPTLKLDVWISPEGYVLRERVPVSFEEAGQRFKATLALDYLDVGRPQQVELPDDDEVQDVTGQAIREANG